METPVTDMDSPSKKLALDHYHRHHAGELHQPLLSIGHVSYHSSFLSLGSLHQPFASLRPIGKVRENSHSIAAAKSAFESLGNLCPSLELMDSAMSLNRRGRRGFMVQREFE